MRVLYISEVTGKCGIWCVKSMLDGLKREFAPHCTIINGNSATGGGNGGIGRQHAGYLHKLGGDILTAGAGAFFKSDLRETIGKIPWFLRPANLSPDTPGKGILFRRTEAGGGAEIAVLSLIGTGGPARLHGENPFAFFSAHIGKIRERTPFVFVDFTSAMTAEKRTFFYHAEGLASAVFGSGTKVQTADAEILPGGTAVLTDCGRTGSLRSVAGCSPGPKIFEYLTGVPDWSRTCWDDPAIQGVLTETDESGKALRIQPFTRRPAVLPKEAGG